MILLFIVSKIRDFAAVIADKLSRFIDRQLMKKFEGR